MIGDCLTREAMVNEDTVARAPLDSGPRPPSLTTMRGVTGLTGEVADRVPRYGAAEARLERRTLLALAVAAVAGVAGFVAQMLQTVDPMPGYMYFSPLVALAVGLASTARMFLKERARAPRLLWFSDATAAGVVLASAVYWFALVPVNGFAPTSDPYSFSAALLIHVFVPAAGVTAFAMTARLDVGRRAWVWGSPILLAVYGVAMFAACWITGRDIPYQFIDPTIVGPWLAVAFFVLSGAASLATSWALLKFRQRLQTPQ